MLKLELYLESYHILFLPIQRLPVSLVKKLLRVLILIMLRQEF